MRKVFCIPFVAGCGIAAVVGCSSGPVPETAPAPAGTTAQEPAVSEKSKQVSEAVAPAAVSDIPASYKDIQYPEYKYVAPDPREFRVELAPGISGYIVSDRSLPLVNLSVYFENPRVPTVIKDVAGDEMVGMMVRRGGGEQISSHALDDTLEFVSAGLSTSIGTWVSSFSVNSLTKDFPMMLDLAQKVVEKPAFDKDQLEIVKTNFVTAYEQRYDTPAKVLSALRAKVNYAPCPRLWDANAEEYKKVSVADMKRLSQGAFAKGRVVFALSGDIDRDSAIVVMKDFFAKWNVQPLKAEKGKPLFDSPKPIAFLNKPGIYVVDKDISQANITLNQPFVMRPHPDYYPAAVANFILGGGSFSSRLMTRVRSDEGLAYHISSRAGNDYRDTAMISISLQTKVESAPLAMKLIYEEIDKLASEGPTEEELSMAKKTLVESLPGEFDSPASTAIIFAQNEMIGKKLDHYVEYVKEINAVTVEQVKAMIKKYYGKDKMTVSVVGPVAKLEGLKPFTVVPLDSLEFR